MLAVVDFYDYASKNGLLVKSLEEYKETYPAVYIENFDELLDFIFNVKDDKEKIFEPLKKAHKKYDMFSVNNSVEKFIDYLKRNDNL